jgi:polysaccharide lyase-like protein
LGTGDFDSTDYDSLGDLNNVNERMSWVADPGGSGKTVTEIRLEAGDHANGSNAPSDHRAELYSRNRDLDNHEVGWQVLGFRLPSGNPSGQYGIFQNHAVKDALQKTPPQNLNVDGDSLALGIRKIGQNRVMHTIGSAAPNVWHYVVLHIRFDSGNNGFVEAWAADNHLPDVSLPPAFADYGYSTLNGGNESSRTHIGFYQDDLSWAGKIWYCGYHRAASYPEASRLTNCPIPTGG